MLKQCLIWLHTFKSEKIEGISDKQTPASNNEWSNDLEKADGNTNLKVINQTSR